MNLRIKIFSVFFLIATQFILGQNDSLKNVGQILENILNDATLEQENSPLYDLIEQYIENPIDLNSARESEILELPFLDIESANAIILHRKKFGRLFSYSELSLGNTISQHTLKILEAFTFLVKKDSKESNSFFQNYNLKLRSRISSNIQTAEGHKNGYYKGSPIKLYNRLKLDANSKIRAGILVDKDAGEKSYFDFYSFYLQVNNLLPGLSILGGYYTIEFGQGLAMWSPYSFSKSSEATNSIIKRARGISPYTSAGEYLFMKGGAISYSNNYFGLTSFYSLEDDDYFNSSKNTFGFTTYVSPIENIKISALYFQRNDGIIYYTDRTPQDSIEKHLSLSYKIVHNNLFLNGEFSFYNSSIASINTLQLSLLREFLIVASIRNYPSSYQSYYAQGFGETKRTSNEFGIYLGFKWRTELGIINFYLDQFKFPNSTSSITLPSSGNELSLSYKVSPAPKTILYFRYFSENKEVLELVLNENKILNRKTDKFRTEFIYNVSKSIKIKSRVELLYLNETNSNENGLLLFQDFKYSLPSTLTLYGRIIFFQTDSFASRIYEFENDLIGVMTNQPLWGSGIKWYLLIRYNPFNNFKLSLKYSELYKPNETFLGSGYNLIEGNLKNKISLQIDYSF